LQLTASREIGGRVEFALAVRSRQLNGRPFGRNMERHNKMIA
jgi:hypothetical protein